jgi:hypothetical protein
VQALKDKKSRLKMFRLDTEPLLSLRQDN